MTNETYLLTQEGIEQYFKAKLAEKALQSLTPQKIDEISKDLVGKYLKKAVDDKAAAGATLDKKGSAKKLVKRHNGINKAIDKLTKEEVE